MTPSEVVTFRKKGYTYRIETWQREQSHTHAGFIVRMKKDKKYAVGSFQFRKADTLEELLRRLLAIVDLDALPEEDEPAITQRPLMAA